MAKTPKSIAPVDENVTIPAAVKAAGARSDAIHQAAYAQPPEDPAAPPVEAPEAPPVAAIPEPAPAPAPAPPPAPPAAAPAPETWEHKYNSMKGRFERADNIARSLSERLTGMEAAMAAMTVAPPAPPPTSLVTPEEVASYGQEFLEVVGRKAREQVTPEVAQLTQRVEDLTKRLESVGTHVAQDARSRTHEYLNKHCPNWLELNENEKFKNWLALPDTYSHVTKHVLLKAAYAANDAPQVLAFFNGFLSEEAAGAPPAPAPDPAATVPVASPKVPLESLAAPGRAKTAAQPVPAEKPNFTRAEVTRFYVDAAGGKFRGRDDERIKIEKQIHDAGREGRIS